jgi:hypothetical protein
VWIAEARDRLMIKLLGLVAATNGWKGLGDLEDPAEVLEQLLAQPAPAAERASDPTERAAQVINFLAAMART